MKTTTSNNMKPLTKKDFEFAYGKEVMRIASDYTAGRVGNVVEVDHEKGRARVQWSKQGPRMGAKPMNLKTWVKFGELAAN